MRKNIIIRGLTVGTFTAALVGGVALASAGPASAYTMDAAGQGFVGKGEVQSAFGWNNAKMQANQNGVTFTVKQNASQALSSSASQTATQEGSQSASQTGTKVYSQTATQDVTETLSCFKNGAAVQNVRHGVRSGERSDTVTDTVTDTRTASRDGERDGSRTGSRTGTLSGTLVSAMNVTDKKTGQYTGWFLKGYNGSPQFVATGPEQFDAPSYGEWGYGAWGYEGDFEFPAYDFAGPNFAAFDLSGEATFGPWDTDSTNADPDVCVNNGNGITNFHQSSTVGPIVEGETTSVLTEELTVDEVVPGATHESPPEFGGTEFNAVTGTGPTALYATFGSVSKLLTPTPVSTGSVIAV